MSIPCSHRVLLLSVAVMLLAACTAKIREGALVVTQTPITRPEAMTGDVMDLRYPLGSRVVLAVPPYQPTNIRVLSKGLAAAGDPVVCPTGQRVFFAGKLNPASRWQIYQASLRGGPPTAVTETEGGAMNPAIMAQGDLVFSSPVPKAGETWKAARPAALFAQAVGGASRRLTFGTGAAVEPTVLRDGRILFVSAVTDVSRAETPGLSLFTINNDGTEPTAFALDRDGAPIVHRPRELPDRRVAFLTATSEDPSSPVSAEAVRTARPFASRAPLFPFPTSYCWSVESESEGGQLVCLDQRGSAGIGMSGSSAVYRTAPEDKFPSKPLFDDPQWHETEAIELRASTRPMGHMSTIAPEKKSGTILCLDVNFTRQPLTGAMTTPVKTARIRVLSGQCPGECRALGEIVPQADGSFMAEVPADTAIGFESLDDRGQVLQRLPPFIWVRPGENRSCVGCHQPPNRSPRNVRPLAVTKPPINLAEPSPTVASHHP